MRRDLTAAALIALVMVATVPAYDRVFVHGGWRTPAILAGVFALTLAVIVRRLGGGGALSALVSALGAISLTPWLLGTASGPRLPTPTLLGELAHLFEVGSEQLAVTPAPAEPLLGLLLLLVVGWWTIAHFAHELAVRWRRPGLSLAIVAVLWSAPLAIPMPGPPTPPAGWFLAAGTVFLLVTAAERRRSHHARLSTAPTDTTIGTARKRWVDSAHRLVPGVAIGSLAVLVATSVTGMLPGYGAPAWIDVESGAGGRGYQPMVDISQRLQLPEARDVLRVRSSQRTYLRLAGLDTFDGSTWRLGGADDAVHTFDQASLTSAHRRRLPPEAPATRVEPIDTRIEVLALENVYVPVPYQPTAVLGSVGHDLVWSTDGGVLMTRQVVAGTDGQRRAGIPDGVEYRVTAERPAPTFEALYQMDAVDHPTNGVGALTQLPRDYPELHAQAQQVYTDAGAQSVIERVLALQDWFVGPQGGFTYDLDVAPLRDEHALRRFVLEDRVGYCEYFATAMAVMLRTTGIPARVAVGFLPGRMTDPAPGGDDNVAEYTVSTTDAHAWVEVLFPGHGWIAFEPTPRSDDTHMVPRADDLTPIENEAERRAREPDTAQPVAPPAPTPPPQEAVQPPHDESADAHEDPPHTTRPGAFVVWPLVVASVAAAVLGTALVFLRRRRRSGQDPEGQPDARIRVVRAQRALLTAAASYGIPRRAHETVHEAMDRWQQQDRMDPGWNWVAQTMQSVSFGAPTDTDTADDLERAAGRMVAQLRASSTRVDRLLAPLRGLRSRLGHHGRLRMRTWKSVNRARQGGRIPGGRVRPPR